MPTTRMTRMPVTTAAVARHSAFARALDGLATLAGAEGAAVVDATVRTHLAGVKGKGAALDLPLINGDS